MNPIYLELSDGTNMLLNDGTFLTLTDERTPEPGGAAERFANARVYAVLNEERPVSVVIYTRDTL